MLYGKKLELAEKIVVLARDEFSELGDYDFGVTCFRLGIIYCQNRMEDSTLSELLIIEEKLSKEETC